MPKPPPPCFIVHDLAQAKAALAAAADTGVRVRLESAADAAAQGGAAWWNAVIEAARAAHPEAEAEAVLDCGAAPGRALGAIREGAEAIRCRAKASVRVKLEAIAKAARVAFLAGAPGPACDLGLAAAPEAAARAHLAEVRARSQNARRAPRRRRLQKA